MIPTFTKLVQIIRRRVFAERAVERADTDSRRRFAEAEVVVMHEAIAALCRDPAYASVLVEAEAFVEAHFPVKES